MSYPETPPKRLSSDPNHADFHVCYRRVGVRFDGAERTDVLRYDARLGRIFVRGSDKSPPLEGVVEPFWRWAESRQERRARERFDAKHGTRD